VSILTLNTLEVTGVNAPLDVQPSETAPWTLKVSGSGFCSSEFVGDDLFDALISLRRVLDQQGRKLLCAGARKDVSPSGMSRNMGNARKAYVTKIGAPATQTVDIFDPAEPDEVGTVNEQRLYRDTWIASLKEKLGA
jgi:hypothetical protein